MSLQSKYLKFHEEIKLTRESDEYRAAREKDNLITAKIKAAFKEKGYEVVEEILLGSMKVHTGIHPPKNRDYDVDRGLVISDESAPEDAVEPKKIVKDVLSKHGFSAPKIKKPCVTADYIGSPIHIDFTTFKVDSYGNYHLAIGKENALIGNKYWDNSDPKGLVEWIQSTDNHQNLLNPLTANQRQQFIRLVRYLKRWRNVKYTSEDARSKIFSIALTIMAKKSFVHCDGDDNKALSDTLSNMLESYKFFTPKGGGNYGLRVKLPVSPQRDVFNDKGDQVANALRNRLSRLKDVLDEVSEMTSEKKQCEKLQEQLGDDFPDGVDTAPEKQLSAGISIPSSGA